MLLYVLWATWGERFKGEGINVACMDLRGESVGLSNLGRARDSNCMLNMISPFLARKQSSLSLASWHSGSSTSSFLLKSLSR
uniref:Uncharacterized protein n=1 Tax=Anguilla anguilla TaxID=7936 RepID=A0A0E9X8V7_ANGAN